MPRFANWPSLVAGALLLLWARVGSADQQPIVHEVQRGQTLAMIAKRYNVRVEAIQHANRIRKRNHISPGHRLVIPTPADRKGTSARRLRDAGYASPAAMRARSEEQNKRRQERRAEAVTGRTAPPEVPSKRAGAPETPSPTKRSHKRGWVKIVGVHGTWQGFAVGKGGAVTDAARKGFAKILTSRRTGQSSDIDPRLISLVSRVSDEFRGATIHVVSGYRPKAMNRWTPHSRHGNGRAIDFRVEGVSNRTVRDFVRGLGAVGVGYYPNSSFVHLDVRDAATYWVDYSGPGERPRYAGADGRDPGVPSAAPPGKATSTPPETSDDDDEHDEPTEQQEEAAPPGESVEPPPPPKSD